MEELEKKLKELDLESALLLKSQNQQLDLIEEVKSLLTLSIFKIKWLKKKTNLMFEKLKMMKLEPEKQRRNSDLLFLEIKLSLNSNKTKADPLKKIFEQIKENLTKRKTNLILSKNSATELKQKLTTLRPSWTKRTTKNKRLSSWKKVST